MYSHEPTIVQIAENINGKSQAVITEFAEEG